MNFILETSQTRLEDINIEETVNAGDEISIFVESVSDSNSPKAALIAFHFEDASGATLEIPNWNSISKVVGPFSYLSAPGESGIARDRVDLIVPEGATKVCVTGKQWQKTVKTSIVGKVQIQNPATDSVVVSYPSGASIPTTSEKFSQRISLSGVGKKLKIATRYIPARNQETDIPLAVRFLDCQDEEILSNTDFAQNPQFGSFISLPQGPQVETDFAVHFEVPAQAYSMEIRGVEWSKTHATILRPFEISSSEEMSFDIRNFMRKLDKNVPLLILDTTAPPLGHETLALRPNNLAAAYTRLGWAVVFIPFGSLQGFPPVINEMLVQVPRDEFDVLIKSSLAFRDDCSNVFVCSSFPNIQSVTAMQRLRIAGWKTVYECRDDMEEFNRVGYSKWYVPQLERQALRLADLVVSVSSALDKKLVSLYPSLKSHKVVPNAVNRNVIDSTLELRTEEARKMRNHSKIIGYVGHLTESWFDWPVVIQAAKRLPGYTFEIVGHGIPKNLRLPDNVKYLGPKTHMELKNIVSEWKVGIIPFLDIPLTRSVDPNKIYEYFAWGLRCVSAPMGMVESYPSTWVFRGIDQFVEQLQNCMKTEFTVRELEDLEKFLETASWDDRARTMVDYFEAIERKGSMK